MVLLPPPATELGAVFRRAVEEVLGKFQKMSFCGDFNTTLQPAIDSSGSARPESWQWLREQIHLDPRPLTDSFRTLHPMTGVLRDSAGGGKLVRRGWKW